MEQINKTVFFYVLHTIIFLYVLVPMLVKHFYFNETVGHALFLLKKKMYLYYDIYLGLILIRKNYYYEAVIEDLFCKKGLNCL